MRGLYVSVSCVWGACIYVVSTVYVSILYMWCVGICGVAGVWYVYLCLCGAFKYIYFVCSVHAYMLRVLCICVQYVNPTLLASCSAVYMQ